MLARFTAHRVRCSVIKSGRMKRALSAVAAAVLVSMMALMFLGGLLKKAARVADDLGDRRRQRRRDHRYNADDNTVHVRNGSG